MAERKIINGWVYERSADGRIVPVGPAGGASPTTFGTPDANKVRRDTADADRAVADAAISGAKAPIAGALSAADLAKAQADADRARSEAITAQANAASAASGQAKQTSEMREKALKGFADTQLLDQAIQNIEQKYKAGPGATKNIWGVQDYFGTPANTDFDNAGNSVRALVKGVLAFTGQENNTPQESEQNFSPYIPQASDWDSNIESKVAALKRLRDSGYERAVRSLGGVPDAQGNVTPLPQGELPNAMTVARMMQGQGPGAAAFGADRQSIPVPTGLQSENATWLQQNLRNIDPDAYVAFRMGLDQKYGLNSDPDAYRKWAEDTRKAVANGATVNTTIPGMDAPLQGVDKLRNDAVNNPVGAGAAGFLDAGSFGAVDALTGGRMASLREAHPNSALVGEIAGSIAGTNALGKLGKAAVTKALPYQTALKVLEGGGDLGKFGRNLAADTAYGGIYGGVTDGDPITGALESAVGSTGGQLVGKAAGKLVEGASLSPAAKALRERGVDLTGGRILGSIPSRIEDKLVSVPIVGDMIGRRQADAFRQFNEAAFKEGGKPIGFQPSAIGSEGLDQFGDAVSGAYKSATDGVTVPFDHQFLQDAQTAVQGAMNLPPDLRKGLGEILTARVQPIADTGAITGNQYQQALRALKATRSKPPARFEGFEQEYKDAVSGVMDALTAQMERGGGEQVAAGLSRANAANKNFKILQNASLDRARVGTRTGEAEVFAPSQLVDAARASERKYGANTLKGLGKQGQEVLPSKVPNSGTTDRAIMAALALGGLSAGSDATLDTNVSPYAAALTALLAAGGTRRGQKLITAVLADRPEVARRLGSSVGKRAALFGNAGATAARLEGY